MVLCLFVLSIEKVISLVDDVSFPNAKEELKLVSLLFLF